MPPLPGETWVKVKSTVESLRSRFFGGTEADDSPANSIPRTQAHVAESEDMIEDASERSSADGLGKRVRGSSEQVSSVPANKKQRKYSQEEGAYFGNYNGPAPKSQVQLWIPTSESKLDDDNTAGARRTQSSHIRAKPGAALQHRLQNNLHAMQPGRMSRSHPPYKQLSKVDTEGSSARHTMEQGKALDKYVGDGFSEQSKRRRTKGAPPVLRASSPTQTISDDEDEHHKGTIRAVNGMSVASNSGPIEVDSQSQTTAERFKSYEQRSVNQYIASGHPIKKRRRRESGPNAQSVSSLLQTDHHSPARSVSGSRNQPLALDSQSLSPARSSTHKTRTDQLPKIELGKGVDDFDAASMQRRKEDHDLDKMNKGLGLISHPPSRSVATGEERGAKGIAQQPKVRQSHPTRQPPAEHHQSLRSKFKRLEDITPQQERPRRQSMARNMQAASNNTKAKTVEESPDHLHGGNTEIPRSQQKRNAKKPTSQSPTRGARELSPSYLPPTLWKNGAPKPTRTKQPAREVFEKNEIVRIPLEQIFSRGCVLDTTVKDSQDYVDLVWQPDRKEFVVERNGNACRITGTQEYMTIGMPESKTWYEGKGSTKVELKGSAREGRSNGIILLSFVDEKGLRECYHRLSIEASADTLRTFREENGRIEKIFQKQAMDVKIDAHKYSELVRAKLMANHCEGEQVSPADDIVYEADESPRQQTSARSRMKVDTEQPTRQPETSPCSIGTDNRETRKSTRQPKPVKGRTPSPPLAPIRWTETHGLPEWHQSVMYPATGARRITVDVQDLERLDEGEYLNDNLVGYALRRIEEDMAPEHKSKVHFFNSYFFTSLASKNGRKVFNYEAVKKWTKQNDLFNTPYVVVPINENLHWFVAIICNLPNLARKAVTMDGEAADTAETPPTSQRTSVQPSPIRDPDEIPDSQEPGKSDKPDSQAMRQLSLTETEKASAPGSNIFEFDAQTGRVADSTLEEHEQANDKQSGKKSKKRAPSLRKYPTNEPTIITIDSFGVGHPGQISTLKKYVEAEAMDKRGMKAAASDIQGMTATGMPTQSNYCDCGLYLVGYVAEFARDPDGFVSKVLNRQLDEDNDFASFDPSDKRTEIRDDLLKLYAEQNQAKQALKKAKKEKEKAAMTAVNSQTSAPVTLARASPARSPPKYSAHGQLCHANSPKVSPEKLRAPHEPGPARQTSVEPATSVANDASHDEKLEEQPPKPLPADKSCRTARKADAKLPHQGKGSAESVEKGHRDQALDDEMLDQPSSDESGAFAQRRPMRKVASPGLDTLGEILNRGMFPTSPAKNAL
jgi:sentrin-specific protease 7